MTGEVFHLIGGQQMVSSERVRLRLRIKTFLICALLALVGCGKTEVVERTPTRVEQAKQIEIFLRAILAKEDGARNISNSELEANWRKWFAEVRYGKDAASHPMAPPSLASKPSNGNDTTTPFFVTDMDEIIDSRSIIKTDQLIAFGVVDEEFAMNLSVNWSSGTNLSLQSVLDKWCHLHADKEIIPSLELVFIFSSRPIVISEMTFYPGF